MLSIYRQQRGFPDSNHSLHILFLHFPLVSGIKRGCCFQRKDRTLARPARQIADLIFTLRPFFRMSDMCGGDTSNEPGFYPFFRFTPLRLCACVFFCLLLRQPFTPTFFLFRSSPRHERRLTCYSFDWVPSLFAEGELMLFFYPATRSSATCFTLNHCSSALRRQFSILCWQPRRTLACYGSAKLR